MNGYANKKYKINTTKIVAIILTVVSCVCFGLSINSLAITSQGFVTGNEITPVNYVLFSNTQTGIVSNPENIAVYACCGITDDSNYGVVIATTDRNYRNLVVQNLARSYRFEDARTILNYNGNTIYLANAWASSSPVTDNNYVYATFDRSFHPTNSIAENFLDYVTSGGIDPSPLPNTSTINYSIPAGNIAIIETNSSYSYVNLTSTMPLISTSFANNPWPNTTQRIGYYNTLPQTLNPNTMGSVIEWERNGNTTLFNITTSAKYNPSVVSTFKYVVIANPYYYPANDMEDSQFTNGAINISMDGVVNITVKSLTATVNNQTGEVENNYNGAEWTGEVDEDTNDIIWTDENGENNAPTSGGNLSDPSISGFQSWLKGILNNIVNIFKPAHDAINTLSGAVSNFASWMYALYVWLPSPILSLLTSAISLAIVIGIIKVFL